MASFHSKVSRGHRYWYIVESRRVNGKPRPVVLAYLGKAEDLLRRLEDLRARIQVKSYAHGAVAALLKVASALQIPELINRYVPQKPIRNHLTVGMTLLLGAIGRVCRPTSKRAWWNWAQHTSCEYLLRCSLSRMDSQHFWDLMDALPLEALERIETQLLQRVQERYHLSVDSLFYDTTNFFTYIATTNCRCTLAQRGKNKQKRHDLRQVGLALVVSQEDLIPLFHLTYEGNRHDSPVFQRVTQAIQQRLLALGLALEKHTLVFDRGNNSKTNLAAVQSLGFHYVGALTPHHHQTLIRHAQARFQSLRAHGEPLEVFRDRREVWGESRTVVVYRSERLQQGQWRGIQQILEKKIKQLQRWQNTLQRSPVNKPTKDEMEARIALLVKGQYLKNVIDWSLTEESSGRLHLEFSIHAEAWAQVEEQLGLRILMTSRHDWSTEQIIQAYHGQSHIESAFRNLKNPYHLTLKPQFHWTDQKIRVHYFMCVLGYLLATLVWKEARQKGKIEGSLDSLLDTLSHIRLATLIEKSAQSGRPKVTYQLEELSAPEEALLEALDLHSTHLKRPKFQGVSVYTSDST